MAMVFVFRAKSKNHDNSNTELESFELDADLISKIFTAQNDHYYISGYRTAFDYCTLLHGFNYFEPS